MSPSSTVSVVLTLIASGSVGDYAYTASLQQKVATVAGVGAEFVSIFVEAASVRITATITVPAAFGANVMASLSKIGTASAASAALGITVEAAPTIGLGSSSTSSPPPAPTTSPTLKSDENAISASDEGVDVVIIIIIVAALFVSALLVFGVVACLCMKKKRAPQGPVGVQITTASADAGSQLGQK